jgi:hypothetical protein
MAVTRGLKGSKFTDKMLHSRGNSLLIFASQVTGFPKISLTEALALLGHARSGIVNISCAMDELDAVVNALYNTRRNVNSLIRIHWVPV